MSYLDPTVTLRGYSTDAASVPSFIARIGHYVIDDDVLVGGARERENERADSPCRLAVRVSLSA